MVARIISIFLLFLIASCSENKTASIEAKKQQLLQIDALIDSGYYNQALTDLATFRAETTETVFMIQSEMLIEKVLQFLQLERIEKRPQKHNISPFSKI